MKIYDIISENTVQEAAAVDLLKLAGKGIASGAKWLAQTGSRRDLVSMMSQNSQLIRNTLKGSAPTAAQIEKIYGPRAGEIYAKDPNFMAKVLKQYHADRAIKKGPGPGPNPSGPNPPPPIPPAGSTTSLIRKIPVVGLVSKAISVFGIYNMVQDYNQGIAYFDEQLKNGMSQEKYDAGVAHLKSTLVFQIAASTVVFSVLKQSTGWGAMGAMLRGSSSPLANKIGGSMGSMSSAARAALITALSTKEARSFWSDLFAGSMMDNIGKMTYDGVAELIDMAKKKANDLAGNPSEPEPKSDTGAAADKDASSTAKPETPASTNTSPYRSEVPSTSTYKGNPMFKGIN
jgi:hypothetical protein